MEGRQGDNIGQPRALDDCGEEGHGKMATVICTPSLAYFLWKSELIA